MKNQVIDGGTPYENLAAAIIIQAADDWRSADQYLRRHPRTRRLRKILKKQERAIDKQKRKRTREGLPPLIDQTTPEMRLFNKINASEALKRGCERFFCGQWFEALSDLDGKGLLQALQREADALAKGGDKNAKRSAGAMAGAPKAKVSGG